MQHVEAMEFFDRVVSDEEDGPTETVTLEHQSGAALDVYVEAVDRKEILDQLQLLPDEMLEVMGGAEDPEEAEELAEEANMLTNVNGDVIEAFENLCVQGITHPELTQHNLEMMVDEFDFEVLFGLGMKVMEKSFDGAGSVQGFHEQDSARSS